MFRTLLDPPFTAPSHIASTSSSLLFPSNWTSTETLLLITGCEPNAPTEVSSEATPVVLHSRRCSLESTCDDLATTLDASEAGERSDLGWLASPLFPRERETSAYHSECITQIEKVPKLPFLTCILASSNRQREVAPKESPFGA